MTDERANGETAVAEAVPGKRRIYTVRTLIAAWLFVVASISVSIFSPSSGYPLAGTLFLIACAAGVFLSGVAMRDARSVAFLSCSVILALSLLVSGSEFINTLSCLLSFAMLLYAVYCGSGDSIETCPGKRFIPDLFKALVFRPFSSFHELFVAAFSTRDPYDNEKKKSDAGKTFLFVAAGLAFAAIPALVICILLSSDEGFDRVISSIFENLSANVFVNTFDFIFGVITAAIGFGAIMSAKKHRCTNLMTGEKCDRAGIKVRVIPSAMAAGAALPILTIYGIFFFSQWEYYISAFTGILPDGYTYSGYSVSGFYAMCAVAVINALAICLVGIFIRRNGDKRSFIHKAVVVSLSVSTLILMATAMSKLILYIGVYGLTHRRAYAMWFMVLLAFVFVIIIVKQFAENAKTVPAIIASAVILFTALAVCNTGSIIARFNVDRYLENDTGYVDVEELSSIGDPAIPALVRLGEALEKKTGLKVTSDDFVLDGDRVIYKKARGTTDKSKLLYYEVAKALREYSCKAESREPSGFTGKLLSFSLPGVTAKKYIAAWESDHT